MKALSSEPRNRIYPWFVVVVLSGAMACSLIDRFALSLLFEPIKADLGLTDTQLGLLHGIAFGLFYATMGIPIAWLIDRWSRKWVIFWGVGLWSLMTALCGLSRTFVQLLGARVGVGVGEAALAPGGYSLITDIIPKQRLATAISVFQMGSLMGGGAAFLLGGAILARIESWDLSAWSVLAGLAPWQLTFIILALPGALFMALILLIREPARSGAISSAASSMDNTDEDQRGLFRHLRANTTMYGSLFIGNACLIAISYGNLIWAPTHFVRDFGWTLPEVGFRFGLVMLIAAPAGVLLGGALGDWWTNRGIRDAYPRVLLLAAILTAPFVILSQVVESALATFAAIGIVQFVVSLVIGIGPATIQTIASADIRARVSAVYVFVVNIVGLGVGPVAVGVMSDGVFSGEGSVLTSLGVFSGTVCALSVLLLWYFRRLCLNSIRPR